MPMKKPRFLPTLIVLLLLLGLASCTSPTTQPAPTLAIPTEELSPMSATPEMEPVPTEISPTSEPAVAGIPIPLVNPGFEERAADGTLPGWTHSGAAHATLIEDNGHSSDSRLTHTSAAVYQVETSQTITGLANGAYTLRAWARSSGGQEEVYLALKCGDEEKRAYVPPTTPGYRWLQLVVSNQVTDGSCTIRLVSYGYPDTWASFDDIELMTGGAALSILGADISSLMKSEDMGGVYRYPDGTQADALQILSDYGMNYARLRVFVEPADGYHGLSEILAMALRLKSQGIKLLVDFHYSDNWADPGKQFKPAAWRDLDFDPLKQAVYDHTYAMCSQLVAQGTPPDMVQVGNEINSGMLWPDGDYNHFDNLAALLSEGYRAVNDCSPDTLVMLHIAEGGDNDMARWWFDNITRRDVPFDVIGISYYPFWHGTLAQLQFNLNDISARYDKDVIVVETAYAFTVQEDDFHANIVSRTMAIDGYLLNPAGQRAMLRDIMAVVRAVPNGRGLGVFYWDATWTAVPGNGWDSTDPASGNAWENQALFDYDDRVLPALEEFLNP
jgi:arabinogalactan endo-1,4-beta-galactosidase